MRMLAIAVASLCSSLLLAQAPTTTDIFLAPLTYQDGRPVVGAPINITNRVGYDNQPSFTPDSRSILFTSIRDDSQADIYRYDLASQQTVRVTSTPESEYSPTVMPAKNRFSVIRVEADSTQRLWSFALDGSDPRLVIAPLKPVGYYAWLDTTSLVMFVLGNPNAMVYGDLRSSRFDTLARGIGRSLSRMPDSKGFSFTQLVDSAQRVRMLSSPKGKPSDLISLPKRTQDLAWLPSGVMLTASGAKLLSWRSGAAGWSDAADLAASGLANITRLAVSPDGKWLAFVAEPRR